MTTKEIEWGEILRPMSWYEAKELERGGWRLPTIPDLTSLFDYDKGESREQAMAGKAFWTPSAYAALTDFAWIVYFNIGLVSYSDKFGRYYVRLVRGGTR